MAKVIAILSLLLFAFLAVSAQDCQIDGDFSQTADSVCARNDFENHYFSFYNANHLADHNYCVAQKPTGQILTNIGSGVCTCDGEATKVLYAMPTGTQCTNLISNGCPVPQPPVVNCYEVSLNKFRTFKSDCEAQRYACQIGKNFFKLGVSGACNCWAQPYVGPIISTTTTTAAPPTSQKVCATSGGSYRTFNSQSDLNSYNIFANPQWTKLTNNGVCRCNQDTFEGFKIPANANALGYCEGISQTTDCSVTPKCTQIGPSTDYNFRTLQGGECEAFQIACFMNVAVRVFSNTACSCQTGSPM